MSPNHDDVRADITIPHLLATAARDRGSDPYIRMGDDQLTLAELYATVRDMKQRLLALSLRPGDRVAVMLPNNIGHAVLILALICLRMVWVPVNPRLRGQPLAHQVRSSDPALIVIGQRFREQLDATDDALSRRAIAWEASPLARPLTTSHTAMPDLGGNGVASDDVVSVMYTSGTTGPAKGVQVTDRMLRAAAVGAAITSTPRDGDVFFLWEPLCHVGGAQVLLLPSLRRVSIAMVERFSATRFWSQAAALGATHVHHLGGILPMLLSRPPHEMERQHQVRISWGGGMTPESWHAAEARFGIEVRECYGMTEASSISTYNRSGPAHGIGSPLPYFDVRVQESDREAPDGTIGEIVLRPRERGLVTPGYLGDPDATRAAWRDGWWHTGDAGRVRDGSLHYAGRIGDSVRHKGENVSAWEVESVVNTHPDIAESALVEVPATEAEQELLLFVTPSRERTVHAAGLISWCRERLATYQVPRYVATVDAFPKTASERVVKSQLPRDPEHCYDAAAPSRSHGEV